MTVVNVALLVALGLVPSLVWMFFIYRQDDHPEPKYLVTKTFLMGIIISPLAILLQYGFGYVDYWGPLTIFISNGSLFFLWAAFVEESLKFFAVRTTALTDPQFDEPVDAMIYMMVAGLGFAAIENILVLFRAIPGGIHATLLIWSLRAVGATLLHALASGILGYFLALSWFFRHHRKKLIIFGLITSILFHFTFNLFLADADNQLRGLALATGLLCLMAFLVSILFGKIKERSTGTLPRLSPITEKEITSA